MWFKDFFFLIIKGGLDGIGAACGSGIEGDAFYAVIGLPVLFLFGIGLYIIVGKTNENIRTLIGRIKTKRRERLK